VPYLRPRRLLRLVAEPPRAAALPRDAASDRAVLPAGRGLALVLRRRGDGVTVAGYDGFDRTDEGRAYRRRA